MDLDLKQVFLLDKDTIYDTITEEHINPKLMDKLLILNNNGFLLIKDTTKINSFCSIPGENIFSQINDIYKVVTHKLKERPSNK